ncbi:MAG: TVP38/TMEM64 family protein [Patescibacteria group bacterium]
MHQIRATAAIAWLIVLIGVGSYVYQGGSLFEDVRDFVTHYPEYSFVAFLIAYAVRPILLIPDSIMLVIGSVTFGPWIGWVGGYIGENVSALIAFSISRFLGDKWASHSHIKFVRKLDKAVTRRGFLTLMYLRLIPIAPFDPINYGAGLTSMSYKTFITGTMLGVIPALTVYVLMGNAITNPKLLIPAAVLLVFISIKMLAIRHIAPDIYSLGFHHHSKKHANS